MNPGSYVIKAVAAGGVTLSTYGGFVMAYGVEIDLLSEETDERIRTCPDFATAEIRCTDRNKEIAQKIAAGDVVVVSVVRPAIPHRARQS